MEKKMNVKEAGERSNDQGGNREKDWNFKNLYLMMLRNF